MAWPKAMSAAMVKKLSAPARTVATPEELVRAGELLEADHPGLAELVRVYCLGRPDEARQHYERTV